jgi:hypothetical protein
LHEKLAIKPDKQSEREREGGNRVMTGKESEERTRESEEHT